MQEKTLLKTYDSFSFTVKSTPQQQISKKKKSEINVFFSTFLQLLSQQQF